MRKDPFGFPIDDASPTSGRGAGTGQVNKGPVLPSDFEFKVTHEPSSYDDEIVPLPWAVGGLTLATLWGLFLFFGGISINAKVQLFSLTLFVGVMVYNGRVYKIFGNGASPLDDYVVPVGEDEEFRGEPLRITKWFRLVFSVAEAPVPEAEGELNVEEVERRGTSSLRVFVEWMILGLGLGWAVERTIAYSSANGPYFYEIFAVHCVALVWGVLFWFFVWLFRRGDDDWYIRRQHVEALNFLICRWFVMYLCIWFFVFIVVFD